MNGTHWRDFVDYIRESGTYRNRIKSLDSDMADFLDKGPQTKGSPYKTQRASFKKKKFNLLYIFFDLFCLNEHFHKKKAPPKHYLSTTLHS